MSKLLWRFYDWLETQTWKRQTGCVGRNLRLSASSSSTVSTFTEHSSASDGALRDIWPSIIQDDLSTRFWDLQWLRCRFYGHKSNLKTQASWALDASRIIPGLNFLNARSCQGNLYDWRNTVESMFFKYEISGKVKFCLPCFWICKCFMTIWF